jgi:hypothetical protein
LLTFGIQRISRALKIRDYRLFLPFSILPTRESSVGIRMEMNVFTEDRKTNLPLRAIPSKRGGILGCRIFDRGTQISLNDHKSFLHLEELRCCRGLGPLSSEAGSSSIRDCNGGKQRDTGAAWSGDWIIRPGGCQFVAEKGEKREKARLFSSSRTTFSESYDHVLCWQISSCRNSFLRSHC